MYILLLGRFYLAYSLNSCTFYLVQPSDGVIEGVCHYNRQYYVSYQNQAVKFLSSDVVVVKIKLKFFKKEFGTPYNNKSPLSKMASSSLYHSIVDLVYSNLSVDLPPY